jgi:hypothetical protein
MGAHVGAARVLIWVRCVIPRRFLTEEVFAIPCPVSARRTLTLPPTTCLL